MKTVYAFALTFVIAACSGPQDAESRSGDEAAADGRYGTDNLAASDACFADTPSEHLDAGQTLIERGPSGVILVSHALDGNRADFEFQVSGLADAQRRTIDAAAADFFRTAGDQYDVNSDAVIYHRARDGSFCAVVRDEATGRALVDAAATIHTDAGEAPTE